jgi:hypothetical protein
LASNANVLLFTVPLFNGSENVNTTAAFGPIPTAPFWGETDTTCGTVVSVAPAPVVNEPLKALVWFPAKSRTELLTKVLITVFPGNGPAGVNVMNAPFTVKLPAITTPVLPLFT